MTTLALCPTHVERFLARIRDAAGRAPARLLWAIDDYDRAELRQPNGRVDTVVALVRVDVRVAVMFRLPTEALGRGYRLVFRHPADSGRAPGLWLIGPGVDPLDCTDVIAGAFDDSTFCAETVLAEIACHRFVRDAAWGELAKTYRLAAGLWAACDGLWCDLLIDLEAS